MIKVGRASELFIAVRTHFEGEYDGFKYGFKLTGIPDNAGSRNYEKLARLFNHEADLIFFLFNAFTKCTVEYVGELFTDEVFDAHKSGKKYKDSLTYQFKSDIKKLTGMDLFGNADGLLRKALKGDINIETLAIVGDLLNYFDMWKTKYTADPFMSVFVRKVEKYKRIIIYERAKIMGCIEEQFGTFEKVKEE